MLWRTPSVTRVFLPHWSNSSGRSLRVFCLEERLARRLGREEGATTGTGLRGQGRFQDSAPTKIPALLLGIEAPHSPPYPSVLSPKTLRLSLSRGQSSWLLLGWKWVAPNHTEQARGSGSLSPNPPHFFAPFPSSCRHINTASPYASLHPVGFQLFSLPLYHSALLVLLNQVPFVHLLSSFQNVANLPFCSFMGFCHGLSFSF